MTPETSSEKKSDVNASRRPAHLRPRRTPPSDAAVIFTVLGITALLSVAMLWWLGALGSGVWTNSAASKVSFVSNSAEWEAARAGGHVVAVFYSESCMACKRMREPFLAASADVGGVTFVGMNANSMSALANKFSIQFVPTVLFVPSGDAQYVIYDGGPSKVDIVKFVQRQLQIRKVE